MFENRRLGLWLTTVWTALGVLLFGLIAHAPPAILILSVAAPLIWCGQKRQAIWHLPSAVFAALYCTALYLLVSVGWSPNPTLALQTVALFFVFAAAVSITIKAMDFCSLDVLRAIAIGFIAGFVLLAAVTCFESYSNQWLLRALGIRDLRIEGSEASLTPFPLNRSLAMLMFLFWPAVLATVMLSRPGRSKALVLVPVLPSVAAVLLSSHATSKVALLGSALIYGMFLITPRYARGLVIVGWTAAILLVVPLSTALFVNNLQTARWLFESAQQRIVIWGYNAKQVAKAPVLGSGIGSARGIDDASLGEAQRSPGTQLASGHSHNAYLQTWREAGAIGALFVLITGLLILNVASRSPSNIQPFLYATFAACALVSSTDYNLWRPWVMASFGVAAIFATLAERFAAAVLVQRGISGQHASQRD